jgi:hypothetical protein
LEEELAGALDDLMRLASVAGIDLEHAYLQQKERT